VDVDFIGIDHDFAATAALGESLELGETSVALSDWPRTASDRFGPAESGADRDQRAAKRADGYAGQASPLHLEAEQLPRPCRPLPSEVLRRQAQRRCELLAKQSVDLASTVEAASIVESVAARLREAFRRGDHRRDRCTDLLRDSVARQTSGQLGDHQAAQRRRRISRLATESEFSAARSAQQGHTLHWSFVGANDLR
jgi:hypothetical protein